ncbi:MAG: hypothetical protein ACWGKN_00185 [Desulfoprunum sp.]
MNVHKIIRQKQLANRRQDTISQRKHLNFDALITTIREDFGKIADHRAGNASISLVDALASGFAMFSLKHSSLLAFEDEWREDPTCLHGVYKVNGGSGRESETVSSSSTARPWRRSCSTSSAEASPCRNWNDRHRQSAGGWVICQRSECLPGAARGCNGVILPKNGKMDYVTDDSASKSDNRAPSDPDSHRKKVKQATCAIIMLASGPKREWLVVWACEAPLFFCSWKLQLTMSGPRIHYYVPVITQTFPFPVKNRS